jgi:glucosamine--fructose-6-phosphate aminotransferase (isomerizing)
MLLLVQALAAAVAGEETSLLTALPEAGQRILDTTAPLAETLGRRRDLERVFFLGSGPQYGVACEAMLKLKEMSITHSEAYHFLEFRHGPKALVDAQSLAVGLCSTRAFAHEEAVLHENATMGAATLALSPLPTGKSGDQAIALPSHLPPWAMPVLYLPTLQLMAYHRAMAKGLDPDNPRNLDAVVVLGDGLTW